MAQIEKRTYANGKSSYRVRIRLTGMPDISASFPLRSKAKEWALQKEVELKTARYFPRDDGKNRTFASFVDYYIEKFLPKNPKSYDKQQQLIQWWKARLGKYYLAHIAPSMIAELRDRLLHETTCRGSIRSSSTVNRYLAALSKAFSICIKELGWLKENPVLLISRPREGKACERYLSKQEIEALLNACQTSRSSSLYSIVVFALSTGARKGEILNLKWKDVDLVRGIATFRDTKNGETRSSSLSEFVIECLRQECQKRIVLSSYVFPNLDGTGPANIQSAWRSVIKKAHLPGVRFHDLRHTAASYLAMGGASTLEIAAVLGHKTLAMVKRYSHLSISSTASALERMNNEIFSASIRA